MAIRDLGYRPYDGPRHGAERNIWIVLRHSLGRAFRSWIVKLVLLFSWVPVAGFALASRLAGAENPNTWLDWLVHVQWMTAAFVLSLAAGAGAIAYDLQHNAFAFFFSKPVTAVQYLVGRVGAVFLLCLAVTLVPVALFSATLVGLRAGEPGPLALAFVRAAAASVALSAFMATASVGLSSFSKSRAFTLSAWVLLFTVPWGLAALVDAAADWPWLGLLAPPTLGSALIEALVGTTPEDAQLRWYHAAPVLVVLAAGAIGVAARRVRSVEVIS